MEIINKATSNKAELIKAETALNSFRDSGFTFEDTVGEYCDNSIQANAREFRIFWAVEQDGKKGSNRKATSIAIADNGDGIAPSLLAHSLTIGFGTRLGDRSGIGKYGAGFKLATLSQAKRLAVYSKPRYLKAIEHVDEDGKVTWTFDEPNIEGKVFRTYFDLEEIVKGKQTEYMVEECEGFPEEQAFLMEDVKKQRYQNGTLFVIEKLDRFNERKSFAEDIEKKFRDLSKFLARAFRVYIDNGLKIFLGEAQISPLAAYDPSFQLENNYRRWLIDSRSKDDQEYVRTMCERHGINISFEGKKVEEGEFTIDKHNVRWSVYLTPEIVRLVEGLGGEHFYKDGDNYFNKLDIKANQGKISFLRQNREISYTIVPKLFPSRIDDLDRHIAITISFPAELDEYFQVRHIKRGAEPVDKLREKLRLSLVKPVKIAREEIRQRWAKTKQLQQLPPNEGGDFSGGRGSAEESAREADKTLPKGPAGAVVSPAQEEEVLRNIAKENGIADPKEQEAYAKKAKQSSIIAIEREWRGKGLIDIMHLTSTVVVYLNSRHPFIQNVYLPLKRAMQDDSLDSSVMSTLKNAADGIDLLFFAYAKAENQSMDPEEDFGILREDWGKFAAVYLKKMRDVDVR